MFRFGGLIFEFGSQVSDLNCNWMPTKRVFVLNDQGASCSSSLVALVLQVSHLLHRNFVVWVDKILISLCDLIFITFKVRPGSEAEFLLLVTCLNFSL